MDDVVARRACRRAPRACRASRSRPPAAAARSSAATAPGIPDVVQDGENGLLVDPDDADELADALVRILSDRATAERLGAAARAHRRGVGRDAGGVRREGARPRRRGARGLTCSRCASRSSSC